MVSGGQISHWNPHNHLPPPKASRDPEYKEPGTQIRSWSLKNSSTCEDWKLPSNKHPPEKKPGPLAPTGEEQPKGRYTPKPEIKQPAVIKSTVREDNWSRYYALASLTEKPKATTQWHEGTLKTLKILTLYWGHRLSRPTSSSSNTPSSHVRSINSEFGCGFSFKIGPHHYAEAH
jgi:hypothetical protein